MMFLLGFLSRVLSAEEETVRERATMDQPRFSMRAIRAIIEEAYAALPAPHRAPTTGELWAALNKMEKRCAKRTPESAQASHDDPEYYNTDPVEAICNLFAADDGEPGVNIATKMMAPNVGPAPDGSPVSWGEQMEDSSAMTSPLATTPPPAYSASNPEEFGERGYPTEAVQPKTSRPPERGRQPDYIWAVHPTTRQVPTRRQPRPTDAGAASATPSAHVSVIMQGTATIQLERSGTYVIHCLPSQSIPPPRAEVWEEGGQHML